VLLNHNLVGLADGAEAVGYDEGRTTFHQAQHGLLDVLLSTRVHVGGGLVTYRKVFDKYSGMVQNEPKISGHFLHIDNGIRRN